MRSGHYFVALTCFVLGCGDDALQRVRAELSVAPEAVDFGEGCIGADNVSMVDVVNTGSARAELLEWSVEPAEAPFSVGTETPVTVPPGGRGSVTVVYAPTEPGLTHQATLVIRTDDDVSLRVPLMGRGGVRRLEVFPTRLDFGIVDESSGHVERSLALRNIGGSPLTVREVVWTSTSADLELRPSSFLAGVIPAKAEAAVQLAYTPRDMGADRGVLTVFSDDLDQPRVDIEVVARTNLCPQVILHACRRGAAPVSDGCPVETRRTQLPVGLDETVVLDAREAVDPEGSAVSFAWTVPERPTGSIASVFPSGDGRTADIMIDREGRYVVAVAVADARGATCDPAEVVLEPRDVRLQLDWDLPTDVDLHLVRPGGTVGDYGNGVVGRSTGSDCATFNRGPDWGARNDRDDDPRLELDAVTSAGSEVLTLHRPESGPYAVYAHHCDSRGTRTTPLVSLGVSSRGREIAAPAASARLPSGGLWRVGVLRWDAVQEVLSFEPDPTAEILDRPELCRSN